VFRKACRRLLCSAALCGAAVAGCQSHTSSQLATGSPVAPTTPAVQCTCTLSFTPGFSKYAEFKQGGGSATLAVATSTNPCDWSLIAPDWVRFAEPVSGRGDAQLHMTVLETTAPREGTIEATPVSNTLRIVQYRTALLASSWCGQATAGAYAPLACAVWLTTPTDPPYSTGLNVVADLRAFGKSERWGVAKCYGCGVNEFDLDLHVPADMAAGGVPITFTASDAQGRTATTTASLQIVR
jgi:hypothetical protein